MKSTHPEVYETIKSNPYIGYGRVFSEMRKSGLRKIKFWIIKFDRNLSVDKRSEEIENLLQELSNQPHVKFAGYNTYSYGRARGWAVRDPATKNGPLHRHIEVWVG